MNAPQAAWFLVGPTAVGKTAVAQVLAERMGAAILSADSMLVYRGMDVGTAKPSTAERAVVPYCGIDLVDPDQPFSAGLWLAHARGQVAAPEVASRDVIVTGGTGLYVRALTAGFDAPPADPVRRRQWQSVWRTEGVEGLQRALARLAPEALRQLDDPFNPRRLIRAIERVEAGTPSLLDERPIERPHLVGLTMERPGLHARIAERVERMIAAGLIDEVAGLRRRFPRWAATDPCDCGNACTSRHAIGYAEAIDRLDGRLTLAQAKERIVTRTRQLAKRQETWFRHQARVTWLSVDPSESAGAIADRVRSLWRQHGATTFRWTG